MSRFDRLTIASRAFCFAAVLGLAAAAGNLQAIQSAILVGAISATAAFVTLTSRMADAPIATGEAILVALLIGLSLPSGAVLLPYLIVPVLIAGAASGYRAVLAVILSEVTALFAITAVPGDSVALRQYDVMAPWIVTALGAGMLGCLLRQMLTISATEGTNDSYESARRLVTQLRTVARRLSAGLDPVGMGAHLLSIVHGHTHDSRSALFVRTDGGLLTPLGHRGSGSNDWFQPNDPLIEECWSEMEPVHLLRHSGDSIPVTRMAFPLRAGNRMIGVVLADVPSVPEAGALRSLMRQMDEHTLRIDTALAFDEVRSIATVEERRRLAREIHDGIAQEIASLGYAVDDLSAEAEDEAQRERLNALRTELSRVVSELRLSIFDLRSEVDPSVSLGSALSDYVRLVGSRSKMTVHLTLDESPTRLRAEIETELLRIAQEAITNARKHSGAENLWVDCRIHPPVARIEVRDDGTGLKNGREDSYGLRIMKERAHRIDAELHVGAEQLHGRTGTLVGVYLGQDTETGVHGNTKDKYGSGSGNNRPVGR